MSVKLWTHGEKWPQGFDLSRTISDFSFELSVSWAWQFFEDRLYGHFEMLQAKIGQEMLELCHFEKPNEFEPSICFIFQGAKKGAFWPNQVFPIASGDGLRWSQGVSVIKLQIHDIQVQKCAQIFCSASFVN